MRKNALKPVATHGVSSGQPRLHQRGREIQAFGTVRRSLLGLSDEARLYSCQRLNQLLADTRILHALYKNHHWVMRGPGFYQLHLLFEKHADEQIELVVLDGHDAATSFTERGDDGTKDLIVSEVIRIGDTQVWSLAEYLANAPLVRG